MKIQHIAAVVALTASLGLVGCQRNQGGANPSAGSGGRSVGSGSKKVPDNARKIAEARNSRVVHRTLRDGTIYVVDATTNKVIFTGPVRSNDNIVVDPKADNISINDTEVSVNDKLEPSHKYALYFVQQ